MELLVVVWALGTGSGQVRFNWELTSGFLKQEDEISGATLGLGQTKPIPLN